MSKPISIEGSIQNNFDRIYVTYYSRMLRFAREYVLFEEDAENVVQDVFLLLCCPGSSVANLWIRLLARQESG